VVTYQAQAPAGHAPDTGAARRHLPVFVIATTERGTRAALAAAAVYAADLTARVVIVVPHVVPYAQPLEHPADPPVLGGERFRDAVRVVDVDIEIQVCVCRSAANVAAVLPENALVIVGGRRRWWRSRDERLAHTLARCKLCALFVADR
jgi:hypothetical protein